VKDLEPMASDDRMPSLLQRSQPPAVDVAAGEVSDGELLHRFVDHWDHEAFRHLVRRHGPMVLTLSKRILRDPYAAEDAFQVTFLLLVRKAGSIRSRESVAPWLYGVARRVAHEARSVASRQHVPVQLDPEVGVEDHAAAERDELHAALHEELGRLPEKYRVPLVLCYIDGLAHEAVARQLGWPIGTVRGRIARGRDLLGERLTRRGLAPAAVLLVLGLLPKQAAAVPERVIEATLQAAARVAAGEMVPRGEVPGRVVDLERKVRKAMHLTRLKWTSVFVMSVIMTGAGFAAVVPTVLAAADETDKAKAEAKKLQGKWYPISLEQGGVSVEDFGEKHLEFDGETFALKDGDKVQGKAIFKLDPSKDPMEMDLEFTEGKIEGKALAIYAWDGANLKFCAVKPGHDRPKDFSTTDGDERALFVLKRGKP
jgi:RNA polymerase sigma factor (sigma-70 family)